VSDVGPQLLGRKPSPPDPRDFKLSAFLEASVSGDPLDLALATLLASPGPAKATKLWAQAATDRIKSVSPPPAPPPPPQPTVWNDPAPTLDQGQTGHCVGFGWSQWGNTDPVNDNYADSDGHAVYYEAKVVDGEPGAEDGSTVRSGAKAMQNRGRLQVYAFAGNAAEAQAWMVAHGPVVLGTDWYDSMFNPDPNGFVAPTGTVAGGHCYLLIGDENDAAVLLNSWGANWGEGGRFRMKWDDLEKLLAANGEACASVEIPLASS
jgi:hypothetical protein